MAKTLRPASAGDLVRIELALCALREARGHLRHSGCLQSARAVSRALKSAEGAQRHALRRALAVPETPALKDHLLNHHLKREAAIRRREREQL